MRGRTGTDWPRWAAVAAVAVGLAAGCSDPDRPGTLPKTSPVPVSSTASPRPTPSTPAQQVEAAVRTYYAELQAASRSNNTKTLRTLIAQNCPCFRAVQVIEKNVTQGERTPEARITVTGVHVHDLIGKTAAAEVKTTDSAYDVLRGDSAIVDHIPAATTHVDLSLVQNTQGRWIVTNLFNLES
jgi:hypothetical protein